LTRLISCRKRRNLSSSCPTWDLGRNWT